MDPETWEGVAREALEATATEPPVDAFALAAALGVPGAARAVGGACGANPVALFIPCHRVIAADGSVGGYAWGVARKEALLAAEGARSGVPTG